MAENKITGIIETSLEQIRNVVDANTIIGTPINTPNGTTVIPVSKVMVGFASGGVDYLGKNMKKVADAQPQRPAALTTNFGGGGGTGVTVQPVGFLVISPDGNVQLLNVGPNTAGSGDKIDSIANMIERSPDIISKIMAIFKKKDTKEEAPAEEESAEATEEQ
ncbi:MAG: sporulation protein YtfJ [Ruminococcaceae bacterium]|nr:sporulation protein YtfJ [Oscillospiraceae bacterium]